MRILIVDDVATVRMVLVKYLGNLGHHSVLQAGNGLEAWNILVNNLEKGEPVEFVICDCKMPKMSGFELLEKARGRREFENIPFLMIAADSEPKNVIESVRLGADDFVVKPFNQGVIKSKISKICSKRRGQEGPELRPSSGG